MNRKIPPHNLGLDLVRVTEAAALVAGRWIGMGLNRQADRATNSAVYDALNTLNMEAHLVIGEEGKIGEDVPLRSGEVLGTGNGPQVDLAVDAIDGAKLLRDGRSGAMSVVGVAPRGTMWNPGPAIYMEKIVVDRDVAAGLVPECLDAPTAWTLALIARLKKKSVRDLTVFVLERERHQSLIDEVRLAGARVWLRADGDIAGAIMASTPDSGVDVMVGTGGILEGLLTACAVKALGGAMLGRMAPQSKAEWDAIQAANMDQRRILTGNDLVASNKIFFVATGITDGGLMQGVRYDRLYARTESIVLRGETGTRRTIIAEHLLESDAFDAPTYFR